MRCWHVARDFTLHYDGDSPGPRRSLAADCELGTVKVKST